MDNFQMNQNFQQQQKQAEDTARGNMFAVISLLLMLVPFMIEAIVSFMTGALSSLFTIGVGSDLGEILTGGLQMVIIVGEIALWGCRIASIVVLIYARVKYPDNVFAKVLMWVYIVFAIVILVCLAVIVISCGIALGACFNELRNCPG